MTSILLTEVIVPANLSVSSALRAIMQFRTAKFRSHHIWPGWDFLEMLNFVGSESVSRKEPPTEGSARCHNMKNKPGCSSSTACIRCENSDAKSSSKPEVLLTSSEELHRRALPEPFPVFGLDASPGIGSPILNLVLNLVLNTA